MVQYRFPDAYVQYCVSDPIHWIRIHHFSHIPIPVQGFDDQKQSEKFTVSIKDVQATDEAFRPHKRTFNSLNMKFLNIFALLDPDLDPLTWLNPVQSGFETLVQ